MSKSTGVSLKQVSKPVAVSIAEQARLMLPASTLTIYDVSWEVYEALMDEMIDERGRRISYSEGVLQIMSLSARHESYATLIARFVDRISLIFGIKILFYGGATMRKKKKQKGNEPDGSFYIQSADLLPNKLEIDFEHDPPPDIAIEVDVHHASGGKLPIYAALGVPEVWLYDETKLTIFQLKGGGYAKAETSRALPILTAAKLTEFLNRSRDEDQYEVLLAFEKWLKSLKKRKKK